MTRAARPAIQPRLDDAGLPSCRSQGGDRAEAPLAGVGSGGALSSMERAASWARTLATGAGPLRANIYQQAHRAGGRPLIQALGHAAAQVLLVEQPEPCPPHRREFHRELLAQHLAEAAQLLQAGGS